MRPFEAVGRSGEVRALVLPEVPQMQEARHLWRLWLNRPLFLPLCVRFVLFLHS